LIIIIDPQTSCFVWGGNRLTQEPRLGGVPATVCKKGARAPFNSTQGLRETPTLGNDKNIKYKIL